MDPYRTCYTRADDPNSKLSKDYIDRSGYNFGIKLSRQDYTYAGSASPDQSYNTPLKPYTKPYTKQTESRFTGLMWVTLLEDHTKVNCDARILFEEATLRYLKKNIGGPNSYEPVCVFVKDYAYAKQDGVESSVLELEITYIIKDAWAKKNQRRLFEPHQENRELRGKRKQCKPKDRVQCSSQVATSSKPSESCKHKVSMCLICGIYFEDKF